MENIESILKDIQSHIAGILVFVLFIFIFVLVLTLMFYVSHKDKLDGKNFNSSRLSDIEYKIRDLSEQFEILLNNRFLDVDEIRKLYDRLNNIELNISIKSKRKK